MGLSSVFSTAITGLSAAETTIDVVGNNVANSSTIGFKASEALFATQFLQTLSLGSAPTQNSGGRNPRQIGLGTQVAAITTDFKQGTIEISTSPSDLAIQGDGFFIIQSTLGEQLYTRNGNFDINSANQLVTLNGDRVLGYGVNKDFEIQPTVLTPLEIPLGSAAVAKPTETVTLQGTLTPTGHVADTASIISSGILGDGVFERPVLGTAAAGAAPVAPVVSGVASNSTTGGSMTAGTYRYKVVYAEGAVSSLTPSEGVPSLSFTATVDPGETQLDLSNLPTSGSTPPYAVKRIYRQEEGAAATDPYYLVGEVANGVTTFSDTMSDAALTSQTVLNENVNTATYGYYVTFFNGSRESRPSQLMGPISVVDGRLRLTDLPTATSSEWTGMRIYRNTEGQDSTYYRIAEINSASTPGLEFTDGFADSDIVGNPTLDFDGPRITGSTKLVNVLSRDSNGNYTSMFEVGTLNFSGEKGGRAVPPVDDPKRLVIDANTDVDALIQFIEESLGIQSAPGPDPANPIPGDLLSGDQPGGSVTIKTLTEPGGQIRFVGNNGADNAIEIGLSSFSFTTATGTRQVVLPFGVEQQAVGQSAVADFVVFDTLGIPLRVRITAVLESTSSSETVYRWFADSPDNDPSGSKNVNVSVGTGLIRFDGEGNFTSATNNTVSISREDVPSSSPLEFHLDFTQISGLASPTSTLAATRQDGFPPGKLTNYIIGEDGKIRGIFDNGTERDLGQIRLARFANPGGLEQRGSNNYSVGINSGLPIVSNPGEQGIGNLIAGAVELSNTDIGSNLIDLILASTQYRGNARVITSAQQLLEELLNLRR
ncbi:MAG: flagellar hook-basal body complex protein [Pirellulales bacterium]|nr:flagellar hook-basal body complex protein [Pirellulales bacterium]